MAPCLRSGKLVWAGRKQRVPWPHMRWWYETHVGPVKPGEHIHHLCGNPWCVEPSHLEALSPQVHRERHKYHGLALGFNETAL